MVPIEEEHIFRFSRGVDLESMRTHIFLCVVYCDVWCIYVCMCIVDRIWGEGCRVCDFLLIGWW